jgi:hypothetical protein
LIAAGHGSWFSTIQDGSIFFDERIILNKEDDRHKCLALGALQWFYLITICSNEAFTSFCLLTVVSGPVKDRLTPIPNRNFGLDSGFFR